MDRAHLDFLITASDDDIQRWHEKHGKLPLDLAGFGLSSADFQGRVLGIVDFSQADLSHAILNDTDLCGAAFTRANATDAKFINAKLVKADFVRTDLAGAYLRNADLTSASLDRANLRDADLRGANLSEADLFQSNFSGTSLAGANFSKARCGGTIFANLDLSEVIGLETIVHHGMSTLGFDTLQRSKGKIPRAFLVSCGLPDSLIDSLRGKYSTGDKIDQWLLRERLGSGGNGEVWKAENQGNIVALKILRSRDPKGEAYSRFRSEIDALRKLQRHRGVLPLLHASLPDAPSRDNPAWLATPVATPAAKRLANGAKTLERAVQATASIGNTLATLHRMGVAHRDIKPDNLFWYDKRWVIGDFGLVDYPEKGAITKAGKKVGPLFFIAPEMLSRPHTADGRPADVYSLAKTLWALATGQNYPPQGEQYADNEDTSINSFSPHPRARVLDQIVQSSTQTNPSKRPTMEKVATALKKWL